MIIDITYTASSGVVYHLQTTGLKIKEANFHRWEYDAVGEQREQTFRVAGFKRGAQEYTATLRFGGPLASRKTLIETLHTEWEADIRSMSPGRITWGDYYLDCYIIKSSTYPDSKGWYTLNDITIYAPRPFWVKPATFEIPASPTPYRITPETRRESPYMLTLYGPVENPRFDIAESASYSGPTYRHYFNNLSLANGEYITIDAIHHTITKTDAGGVVTNAFPSRLFTLARVEYPLWWYFPAHYLGNPSSQYVDMFSNCRATLTLYQERSEPKWT